MISQSSNIEIRKYESEQALSTILSNAINKQIFKKSDQENHESDLEAEENNEYQEDYQDLLIKSEIKNDEYFRVLNHAFNQNSNNLKSSFKPSELNYTVLIDRKSFLVALNDENCRKLLVCLLACAKSVCFVELLPRDKFYVVKLLKENFSFSPCVAAIGSGESDISMLQLADVGISVIMKDGNSNRKDNCSLLINYSDIVVDKFCKLDKLILEEGHCNYIRISKVILLFLYKNCLITLVQLAFSIICEFTGSSVYSPYLFIGFNLFFTTMPILVIGVCDDSMKGIKVDEKSNRYLIGIFNIIVKKIVLFEYFCYSFIQAVILSFFSFKMGYVIFAQGYGENLNTIGTFIYIAIIMIVLCQLIIETSFYSLSFILSILFSIIILILFLIIVSITGFPDDNLIGVGSMIINSAHALLNIFITSLVCICPIIGFKTYKTSISVDTILRDKNKLFWFEKCLDDIHKSSSSWKTKLEKTRFELRKYLVMFKLPYVEKDYAENFVNERIAEFQIANCVIIIFMIVWIILGLTVIDSDNGFTLGRIVLLSGECLYFFFLFTSFFRKHYRFYTCLGILITISSKFGLEIAFKVTSFLATALIPSIIFLVFSVQYPLMILLNTIHIILFTISVSYEYSSNTGSSYAAINSISSIVLIISITLNLAIQSYYYDRTCRTEYKRVNRLKSSILKPASIHSMMLPPFVRENPQKPCSYLSESKEAVSIVLCEIAKFEDEIYKKFKPGEIINFLNKIFSELESLCEIAGVTKVQSFGKTFIACAGLKDSETNLPYKLKKENHARRAVEFAFAILQEMPKIKFKILVFTETVASGVVGEIKPQFSILGGNIIANIELLSGIEDFHKIRISNRTNECLAGNKCYRIDIKNEKDLIIYISKRNDDSNIESEESNSDYEANKISEVSIYEREETEITELSSLMNIEPHKRRQTITSKIRKNNLYNESNQEIISNNPSIIKINEDCDENEKSFRKKKLDKENLRVLVSIFISIITFSILLILNVINLSITNKNTVGPVILRPIILIFLILTSIYHKALEKNLKYHKLTFISLGILMYLVPIILIIYHTGIVSNLIGLEIIYIIMLQSQILRISIFQILLFTGFMLIIWIILSQFYDDFAVNFSNVILAVGFTIIQLKFKYYQEKYQRINFNLKALAQSELESSKTLLEKIMPINIIENLLNEREIAHKIDKVTILFAYFEGFDKWAYQKSSQDIVNELSRVYKRFDDLCSECGVFKVFSLAEQYVVIGYCGNKERNCENVLNMAVRMRAVAEVGFGPEIKVGVHTGDVVAGVIGTSTLVYDIWGPDVLVAKSFAMCSKKGRILVSGDTKDAAGSSFHFEENGILKISGSDPKRSYFLNNT